MITLMTGKRKYSSYRGGARTGRLGRRYVKTALRSGRPVKRMRLFGANIARRLKRIEGAIETKEGLRTFSGTNLPVGHNNIAILSSTLLSTDNGTQDSMNGTGQRVGDSIFLKGVGIKLFLQNQAQRPKVFYRVMVVRSAKGDTPTRDNLFKGVSGNKMIDQVNTERFTILKQQICNVTAVGSQAWTTNTGALGGVPESQNGANVIGAIGTKIVSMWIPGTKFGRGGRIQYENLSVQPKFFSYHLIVLCYDWFYTPQDINNVGAINDGWIKLYYKDA